jgi:hypothetical protein
MDGVIPLMGMLLSFTAAIAIMVIITRARQRKLEIQAELQSKLIEKFGSTNELVTFLQSPAGRQFVSGVQSGNVTLMRDRVLAGYRRAIILSFFGAAFVTLWGITGIEGLAWPGILILALGLGYLVATIATQRLTKENDVAIPVPPQP